MLAFDINRALLFNQNLFAPFIVKRTAPLRAELNRGRVSPATELLVIDQYPRQIALLAYQMNYHHVAQGEVAGSPWMATTCSVCNSGVGLTPVIDGKVHHFAVRGVYNGISLLADRETGSYWEHMTGTCVYGPLRGRHQLECFPLLRTEVEQTLAKTPDIRVAISQPNWRARLFTAFIDVAHKCLPNRMPPFFHRTLEPEDHRRPRWDMGLGVWSATSRRYYPLDHLRANDHACIDYLDGRPLLVYIDPVTSIPAAFYTRATSYTWQGKELHLDTGDQLRNGILYTAGRTPCTVEPPLQMFVRWYAFSLTFPGCSIYADRQRVC